MKAYSISGYPNVFQTGPVNSGIRMELSQPSSIGLVTRYKKNDLKGYILSESFQCNKWYWVEIAFTPGNRLQVTVTDDVALNVIDKDIDFDISNIVVGSGFTEERSFDGRLENFDIQYKLLEKRGPSAETNLIFLKIILMSGILILGLLLFLASGMELNRESKIDCAALIILSGFVASVVYHYIMAMYLNLGFPHSSFMATPVARFSDFTYPYRLAQHADLFMKERSLLPFFWVFFSMFSILPRSLSLFFFSSIFILYFVTYNYRNIVLKAANHKDVMHNWRNVIVYSLLTYPFLFCLERGNHECPQCYAMLALPMRSLCLLLPLCPQQTHLP